MEDPVLKRIVRLISHQSGISIREQDYASLSEKLWQRANYLGLTSLVAYHNYLLQELARIDNKLAQVACVLDQHTSPSEWQTLYSLLTINESYFFRDSNQFSLLTEHLLPEIISHKLDQAKGKLTPKPRLRIWSAGCSTGEELYSLAIALDELHFDWDQWDALLIGTDISQIAVNSARQGLYGAWSFRQTLTPIQQQYFQVQPQGYQICDRLRQRVVFQWGNLLDGLCSPLSPLADLDLILCRNVFIYLDSTAIGQILQTFYGALGSQGYLITGHNELYRQDTSHFQVTIFPESLVYKKQIGPRPSLPKPAPADLPHCASPHRPSPASLRQPTTFSEQVVSPLSGDNTLQQALQEAKTSLRQKSYAKAIQQTEKLLSQYPQCDVAGKIAAQAYANTGRYDQAQRVCYQVLSRHPLRIDMIYLLAQIAEDQNDLATAKKHLQKIIYLDSSFVNAYLGLASIYERENQIDKAQKMRNQGLTLLAKLPPDAVLDDHSPITISQWQEHLGRK